MGSYKELTKMKEIESTKNREEVLDALITLTQGHYESNPSMTYYHDLHYNQTQQGVTSYEINRYLNQKHKATMDGQIKNIDECYENGEINNTERDRKIERIKEDYSFKIRTIQRALSFFIQKEMVYKRENKYFITDNCLYSTRYRSHFFGSQLLSSVMQLHQPSLNTLESNISDLITLFGCYVFISLLESGRPLDNEFVLTRNSEPLTPDEKSIFTEKWLREVIDVQMLYRYFLETFLNQPDDKLVKDLTRVKFKEKRKEGDHTKFIYVDCEGNEYDHLHGVDYGYRYIDKTGTEVFSPSLLDQNRIAVPVRITPILKFSNSFPFPGKQFEIAYELNNELYEKIRKKISANYPDIYERFLDGPGGEVHGAKNNHAMDIYRKIKSRKSNNTKV